MKFTFNVAAFAEIDRALEEVKTVRTRKAALTRGMLKAAAPMAEIARGLAPVSADPKRKRHLRDTIGVGTKLSRRQSALRKAVSDGDGEVTVFIGPDGRPSGVQQEFGNSRHAPHPFMRPAWDQDSRALLERMAELVRVEIFKTLARQRK